MQFKGLMPPLAVHLIWHRKDSERIGGLLSLLKQTLLRDVNYPFSRNLNVPLYFYNTNNISIENNLDLPAHKGEVDVNIVFLSHSFVGGRGGIKYLRELSSCSPIIPVWIDQNIGRTGVDAFDSLNAIRLYEFSGESQSLWGAVMIVHEIVRHGFLKEGNNEPGRRSSLQLFLSHAKADVDCERMVGRLVSLIQQTNLSRFYDKTEISPGFRFDDEIKHALERATVIAFRGEHYASRYWCIKEAETAKKFDRPIVACDMMHGAEDRYLPALSNIPSIRLQETEVGDRELLELLLFAIRETLRCCYTRKMLDSQMRLSKQRREILIRPPEAALEIVHRDRHSRRICYPEPPLNEDELVWLQNAKVDAVTPLWNPEKDRALFEGLRIGVSASDVGVNDFGQFHLNDELWKRLTQDIGRNILVRRGTLVYGGDMRKGGVTEFLLDEAARLKDRSEFKEEIRPIVNYLAWPIHLQDREMEDWRNKYAWVMETRCEEPDVSVVAKADVAYFLPPNTPDNCLVWAKCLTKMRQTMINACDARICVGGRFAGYKGSMPGVLEEVMIALERDLPLYLLGGFGGVVNGVCAVIEGRATPEIDEVWQRDNNPGYTCLLGLLRRHGVQVDYCAIKKRLQGLNVEKLSRCCGLTVEEYRRLMQSDIIEECVLLINKGLANITRKGNVRDV